MDGVMTVPRDCHLPYAALFFYSANLSAPSSLQESISVEVFSSCRSLGLRYVRLSLLLPTKRAKSL